jgi:hypothetical protein
MSDIKFACPDCSQHIVCDDAWCGNAINCPGCGSAFLVPRLAAFAPPAAGHLTLSLPVGSKAKAPTVPRALNFWTEADWESHASGITGRKPGAQWVIWILVFAPFPLALALMSRRAGANAIFACFIVSAVIAGIVAASRHDSGVQGACFGVLSAVGMLCLYAALAVGLLFVGCVFL